MRNPVSNFYQNGLGLCWLASARGQPAFPESNLPVDIVGHCHNDQRPTDPSEEHHSTLVQHVGSWYPTKSKPGKKNKRKWKGPWRTVNVHRVSCFITMIIPQKERGRLWWWHQEHSQIPLVELPNQRKTGLWTTEISVTIKSTQVGGLPMRATKTESPKTSEAHCRVSQDSNKEYRVACKMARFWKEGDTHVSSNIHAFPFSNPLD